MFTPIVQRQVSTEKESFRTGSFIPVIDVLLSEVKVKLKRILERKQSSGQETPKALIELTAFLEPYKEVFLQMFKLCKIALALPVSAVFQCLS